MSSQSKMTVTIAELWQEIVDETNRYDLCRQFYQEWRSASQTTDTLLNSSQRALLQEDEIAMLRNTRFTANHLASRWLRKMSEHQARIADLQQQLDQTTSLLK